MKNLRIEHKEQVAQLQTLESKVIEIIGEIGHQGLMHAFNEWQEQRNVCNSIYNEWLLKLLMNKQEEK